VDREGSKIDSFPPKDENYLYFRLKAYSIKLICVQQLLLTITSNNYF